MTVLLAPFETETDCAGGGAWEGKALEEGAEEGVVVVFLEELADLPTTDDLALLAEVSLSICFLSEEGAAGLKCLRMGDRAGGARAVVDTRAGLLLETMGLEEVGVWRGSKAVANLTLCVYVSIYIFTYA